MDRSFSFESSPSRIGEVDDNVRIRLVLKNRVRFSSLQNSVVGAHTV